MGRYNAKFEKFKELKFLNPHILYMFENGIFYSVYNEDADKVNEIFGFTVKQMGDYYRKCELPLKYFERYEKALRLKKVEFEIISLETKSRKSLKQMYIEKDFEEEGKCNNLIHLEIIQMLQKLDILSLTPVQAINLLSEMQNKVKKIH